MVQSNIIYSLIKDYVKINTFFNCFHNPIYDYLPLVDNYPSHEEDFGFKWE